MDIKLVDQLGREIKINDFVANATKCTSSAYLRRSFISKIVDQRGTIYVKLRSITPRLNHKKWYWRESKSIITNSVSIGTASQRATQLPDGTYQIKVLKLGSLNDTFTQDEIIFLSTTKTKLNV